MHLPIRPIRGRWPSWLETRAARFFWPDPAILTEDKPDATDFRTLMSQVHVGGTIKITGANRHPDADGLLIDNIDTAGLSIADIGASDGSTSLDLIDRLKDFGSYTIADLHLTLLAVPRRNNGWVFFDATDEPVLISGRRTIAWPTQSRTVRRLFAWTIRRSSSLPETGRRVLLLNPAVRARMESDPRITSRVHDVFTTWPEPRPDVIKVANLLRRLYFSDEELATGLAALTRSLPENGHLLVVDNPRTADPTPRAGLYARRNGKLVLVSQTRRSPELADLIAKVDVRDARDQNAPPPETTA